MVLHALRSDRRDRPAGSLATAAGLALALAAGIAPADAAPPDRSAAPGGADSLPTVDSGPRPGPEALYAPTPRAPQLENVGPWRADPILVSGSQAYRDGEWLYQDFLFDDHGATGVVDRQDPYGPNSHLYSPPAGTFTYPTDPVYAHNAADLVELRIRPQGQQTRFRVTLNTLQDPDRTAFTIALGDSGDAVEWPHGAGVSSPAEAFLTVHGDQAELLDAASGEAMSPSPTVDVVLERRQVEVRVPRTAWDPGTETVRVTIGVGLWDADAGTYLAPQPGLADETTPGGGLPGGPALFNVGPRFDEPTPLVVGATMADTAAGARALAPWWRERQQSLQLSQGDVSPFAAEIDFGKLAKRQDDDSQVPTSGPMNRIMASRYVFGQGLDPSKVCFGISAGIELGADCIGRYVGQLHPYAIYVPEGEAPEGGYGLTLLLHSLSANYNQYLSTNNQVQLGERGGSIVVTPHGRGPDGFYAGVPEADVFEVWADVARHHDLDPERVTVTGYSMGGFGTYRLLARWPDLFARGFSVVGIPGSALDQLPSLLHTPVLAWNAAEDELVNVAQAEEAHGALVEAGIPHTYDLFPTADHLTLAGNDEYGPGADYLGQHRVDRDPATVTYVVDPAEDSTHVVADHAYWLSNLALRDPDASPTGTIEVHSAGFGQGRTTAEAVSESGGVLTGGNLGALSFVERGIERSDPPATEAADRLEITATNIDRVTIDPVRARVSCDVEIEVDSDGPIEVELAGCDQAAAGEQSAPPASADAPAPAPAAPATASTAVEAAGASLPATGGGLTALAIGALLLAGATRPRHTATR